MRPDPAEWARGATRPTPSGLERSVFTGQPSLFRSLLEMPTTRRRRRQVLREPLSPALRHWLETGELGDPETAGFLEMFTLTHRGQRAALVRWWRASCDEIVRDWIAAHPGTRPHGWWEFDSPEPQRCRLGGIGTPAHECLAHAPLFRFGLPLAWVDRFSAEYYTGRARDIHGNRIGTAYANRAEPFQGRAIDPQDPPRYESEAAFLDRHGLLSAAERMALPADALKPEVILPADDVLDPEDTL
jgi:hypothetical protein